MPTRILPMRYTTQARRSIAHSMGREACNTLSPVECFCNNERRFVFTTEYALFLRVDESSSVVRLTCDPKTVKFECEDPVVLPGLPSKRP
jgi:hypothetical protein